MSTAPVTPDNPTAMTEGTQTPPVSASVEGTQAPVSAAPPAAPAQPSLWRGVLMGALEGLSGSAGARNFGQGAAGGAKAALAAQAQDQQNQQDQDAAKQAQIQQAASIAHTQAMTAQLQRQTMDLPENHQQTVIEGRAEQTEALRRTGAMIPVGEQDASPDHHIALQQVTALTKANPGKLYTAEPVKNSDGKIVFQAFQSTDAPLSEDVDLKDIDGNKIGVIPKGTPATQATKLQVGAIDQGVKDLSAKNANDNIKAKAETIKANAAATAAAAKGAAASAAGTEWKPKVTADEKKKAELAENIAVNAEAVAQTLQRRPDLVGAISGRFTSFQQMVGNNDPDIASIATHIHNLAMANSGVHGFRSHEGVRDNEQQLFNNFKNGPKAVGGALKASVQSVQTFIDNARPETYKTHSKMGGVLKGMAQ